MTPREMLYGGAIAHLDRDASPADLAPDELGCAESVNDIHRGIFRDNITKYHLSTYWTEKALVDRDDFIEIPIEESEEGDIIIAATRGKITGHMGIRGKDRIIMSNNSFRDAGGEKGIFDENYTVDSWLRYFDGRKGLKTRAFRKIALSTTTPFYGATEPDQG